MTSLKFTPYRLHTSTYLQELQQHAQSALKQWEEAWGSVRAAVTIMPASATAPWHPEADVQCLSVGLQGHGWWRHSSDLLAAMERQLFQLDTLETALEPNLRSGLGTQMAETAIHALICDIAAALTGQPVSLKSVHQPIPKAVLQAGSGAIAVTVALGKQQMDVVIPGTGLIQPRQLSKVSDLPSLVPLETALTHVPVRLSVELTRVTVTLGSLNSLGTGDVLALSKPLHEPLSVHAPGGIKICDAHLGKHQRHKAVSVVPDRTPSPL